MRARPPLARPAFLTVLVATLLAGCATPVVQSPASPHLQKADSRAAAPTANAIPAPVQTSAALLPPRPSTKAETYSVVVNNVKAQDLLFALARDAKINVDVHPGINGTVTLNAIDQTLPQLLTRIAKQVDMRWELDGPNLSVMPDTPFLRTYPIDYVNMARDTSISMSVNSQVSSNVSGTSGASGTANNNSTLTKVENVAKNRFWETLDKNIKDILRETDKILPEGSSETTIERSETQATSGTGVLPTSATGRAANTVNIGTQTGLASSPNPASLREEGATVVKRTTFREAASVIINPETGVVTVRATARQHEKIQEFLDNVLSSARRQVMIEATIVQVNLSSGYQQGIDWSRLRSDNSGFSLSLPGLTTTPNTITPFKLGYTDNSKPLNLDLALQLLENFGTVKVLSSPRLSVLNNQTAVLKVVENYVYFTVKSDVTAGQTGSAQKGYTTTPQTVSVGLVMSVTPQVSANNSVILNVRPSISSISGFQKDPNPDLVNVENKVPQIQTREIESIMRVNDGEIAVLGGLMEERIDNKNGRIPGVGAVPVLGELFNNRDNASVKSELVVFLRPVIVRDPSLQGDFRGLRDRLPGQDFFKGDPTSQPFGNLRSSAP